MKRRRCEICGEIIEGKSYQIRSKHGAAYPVFCEDCWEQGTDDLEEDTKEVAE